MGKTLEENTVQHTLCMPLCGWMITARKYPGLFPDRDAERIVRELGEGLSGRAMYRLQYMWINCVIRQYNLAWEITEYLKTHPIPTHGLCWGLLVSDLFVSATIRCQHSPTLFPFVFFMFTFQKPAGTRNSCPAGLFGTLVFQIIILEC